MEEGNFLDQSKGNVQRKEGTSEFFPPQNKNTTKREKKERTREIEKKKESATIPPSPTRLGWRERECVGCSWCNTVYDSFSHFYFRNTLNNPSSFSSSSLPSIASLDPPRPHSAHNSCQDRPHFIDPPVSATSRSRAGLAPSPLHSALRIDLSL